MEQKDNTINPWVERATGFYKCLAGHSLEPEYNDALPKDPIPAITGTDGIFFGILDFHKMKSDHRDASTATEMKKHGFDPKGGLEQIRFKRPVLAKAIKDTAIACQGSGEPAITFFTEHTPDARTTLIKMAPLDGKLFWVAIDVGKVASTIGELYHEEVQAAFHLHGLA